MSDKYTMTQAAAQRVVNAMVDSGITAFSYDVACQYLRNEGFTQPRSVFGDFIRAVHENGGHGIALALGESAARAAAYALDDIDSFRIGLQRLGFVTEGDLDERNA